MLLSIIIPAFNEARYIESTLQRITDALDRNRHRNLTWEIIVCDNNSSDNTAEIATRMGAKVVFEPVNQISRARNAGAAIAKGKWFLFIDADTYPSAELMSQAIILLKENEFIGCGSTIRAEKGALWMKLSIERLNPFFRFFKVCGGSFVLCEAESFRIVNGFSTDLFAYEEVDFVLRLKRYGRAREKRFKIFHSHPVITSARKGENTISSFMVMVISNFIGVILFILHYLIPGKWLQKAGSRLLSFWYKSSR